MKVGHLFLYFFFFLTTFSFSSEICIYDAMGNCIEKRSNMSSLKDLRIQKGIKKYFVASSLKENGLYNSSFNEIAPKKQKGKKRWYEVDWNQGVKLCPEKNFNSGNGTWIVNGSAHIDSTNCVYVDGSPYTRSILVLYSRNLSDLTEADSSWILVNQVIIELTKNSYKIWDDHAKDYYGRPNKESKYKIIQLKQDLIVDKTELRIKDALWLKNGKSHNPLALDFEYYPEKDSILLLNYPLEVDADIYHYLQWRSENDGLRNIYTTIPKDSIDTTKILYKQNRSDWYVDVFDTSANGYRYPMKMELKVLQQGGQPSIFFWGDSANPVELSKYMNTKCGIDEWGVYPVKQYQPNQYRLYDIYGNAEEIYLENAEKNWVTIRYNCGAYDDTNIDIGEACKFIGKYKCRRKSAKNNSGWVGFKGLRLVRKLE